MSSPAQSGTTPRPDPRSPVRITRAPDSSGVTVAPSSVQMSARSSSPDGPTTTPKVVLRKQPNPLFKLVYRDVLLEATLSEEITSATYAEPQSTIEYVRALLGSPTSVSFSFTASEGVDPGYRMEWARPQLRGVPLAQIAVGRLRVHSVSMFSRFARLGTIGDVHPGAWVAVSGKYRADDNGAVLAGPRGSAVRLRIDSPDPLIGWPDALRRRPIFAIGRIEDLVSPCVSVAILTF